MKAPHQPSGYTLPLGEDLHASVHPGGGLTIESTEGVADLTPAQVERLRELLVLAGGIIGQARRRRARVAYQGRYGE